MPGDIPRRPTIRDVAKAADVSLGTVSKVINSSEHVSDRNRSLVHKAIAELGFEPNTAAQSLKRQRSHSIGLIVPDLQNPFFAQVAEGVHRVARQLDVFTVLGTTNAEQRWEEYYAQTLRARRLDGMILLSGSGKPNIGLAKLAQAGLVVFVDECVPGLDAPFISAANRVGARQVARELLDLGHKRIAIVTGPSWLWTSEQRLSGYREAIASTGLDPDAPLLVSGDYTEEAGYAATQRILADAQAVGITAIIYANDMMALGGMRRLREAGRRIPADMSIIGFDDIPPSGFSVPALTTVAQPGYDMGRAAAQLLLSRIGVCDPPETTTFSVELRLRDSIAAPRDLPVEEAGAGRGRTRIPTVAKAGGV